MIKSKFGPITNPKTGMSKDIVINALSKESLKDILIGDVIGWDICYMIEEMDCYWLDFDNHKTTLEDGLECIIIDTMALSKFE